MKGIITKAGSIPAFVMLAYAISWGWMFPLAATGQVVRAGVGWPTTLPALAGPLLAAVMVTTAVRGRQRLHALLARLVRWRLPWRWWAATVSPLAFLTIALGVAAVTTTAPAAADFGKYSGLRATGALLVAITVVLLSFGEEAGWRGFALPALQRQYGALTAALVLTPIWAVWHLPFFFTVATYRDFPLPGYVGFFFGLACGSIVLTWLYNGTGGSVLACAVWHGLFNLATGTVAATGLLQAITSTCVYLQALLLVGLELRARRRGRPSILGPHRGS